MSWYESIPIVVAEVTADTLVYTGKGRLIGWTLDHTAATSAVLYDNTSAAGAKLGLARVPANGSDNHFLGENGIPFSTGLYVDWTAGTVFVYYKPVVQ